MNAIKLAAGVLFVALATNTSLLSMAQVAEQAPEARVGLADLSEHTAFVSDDVKSASSEMVVATDAAEFQQQLVAPSGTISQDDGIDGCCRSTCNDPCPCFYFQVGALFSSGHLD